LVDSFFVWLIKTKFILTELCIFSKKLHLETKKCATNAEYGSCFFCLSFQKKKFTSIFISLN